MHTNTKLIVYPTIRSMLNALSSNKPSLDVDLISLENFFSKSSFVPDKVMISNDQKYLYLSEVIKDIDVSPLGISNDFLFFLKNKDIIFKFFNEIYNEDISFSSIKEYDVYEEFIEHIEILELVYDKYQDKLSKQMAYDSSSKVDYLINENFIKSFDQIYIFIEGYLSKQELKLLEKLSKFRDIILEIKYTNYNEKVINDLDIKDVSKNQKIIYNLSTKKITSLENIKNESHLVIDAYPVNDNVSEAYFVFYKIDEYIKRGINPEDIVVVLPDEPFANKLKAFDSMNNLNFAMGISFACSKSYEKIQAIYEYLLDNKEENIIRIDMYGLNDYKNIDQKSIEDILDLLENVKDNVSAIIIDALIFDIDRIKHKLSKYKNIEILSYILLELQSKSINDNTGGKIRVMGLLESRHMKFEALILLNCNDKKAPRYSKKDIFLNSNLKDKVGMPTRSDRYNLQKYFYYQLLQNSKNISISYIENDKESKSAFLSELEFHNANIKYHKSSIYFTNRISKKELRYNAKKNKTIDDLVLENKNRELSFSKLDTFIRCKRKFHFDYNMKISKQEVELFPSILIAGIKLHSLLAKLGKENKLYDFKKEVLNLANTQRKYSYYFMSSFLAAEKINKIEQDRLEKQYEIFSIEDDFNVKYKGFSLRGKVDRIDKKDNKLFIIDYKYHNQINPKQASKHILQLTFYIQAMKIKYPQYEIKSAGIYDLKFGKLDFLDTYDVSILDYELDLYKEKFIPDKCENRLYCSYCSYNIICDR